MFRTLCISFPWVGFFIFAVRFTFTWDASKGFFRDLGRKLLAIPESLIAGSLMVPLILINELISRDINELRLSGADDPIVNAFFLVYDQE